MIIEVTKQLIIEALEKEPLSRLRPGAWFTGARGPSAEHCSRCAFGVVLDHVVDRAHDASALCYLGQINTKDALVGPDSEDLDDCGDSEGYVWDGAAALLVQGKPVAALSFYFEGMCMIRREEKISNGEPSDDDDYSNEMILAARQDTIKFVESQFPATMNVDINGYEPAKDVKVVAP